MKQSTVKWFDAKKGYGFINHPDGGDDVFVHYSQIESDDDFKTLRTDQTVQFELKNGPKGPHAEVVKAIEGPEMHSDGATSVAEDESAPAEADLALDASGRL